MTYNAYNNLATTLYNAKTTNNTAWTVSKIKGYAPLSTWIYASWAQMGMQSISVLSWLGVVMGMKKQFAKISTLALLFPLIQGSLYLWAYLSYTACSATTSTQFDGSTSTVTQLSSCSNAAETTTTTGYFGTSGTVAPSVSTDPYSTWFYTNMGSSIAMALVSFASMAPFKKAYGGSKKQKAKNQA